MKKYLLGIIAVVFAIAFSAFSNNKEENSSIKQTSFHWFNGATYDGLKTKSAEMTSSGCQDNVTPICRNGYNSDDLVDPAHPELGIKSNAVADATILRTN